MEIVNSDGVIGIFSGIFNKSVGLASGITMGLIPEITDPLEAVLIANPNQKSSELKLQQVDSTKAASLKMSLSWTCSDPDPALTDKYLKDSDAAQANNVKLMSNILPRAGTSLTLTVTYY